MVQPRHTWADAGLPKCDGIDDGQQACILHQRRSKALSGSATTLIQPVPQRADDLTSEGGQ